MIDLMNGLMISLINRIYKMPSPKNKIYKKKVLMDDFYKSTGTRMTSSVEQGIVDDPNHVPLSEGGEDVAHELDKGDQMLAVRKIEPLSFD